MIDLRYGRDCLESLRDMPSASVHTCVTSPPYYGLRDYGCAGQIGLEPTLDEFVARLVAVFAEVRRVLHPSGTCFVNIGDSYASNSCIGRKDEGRKAKIGTGNTPINRIHGVHRDKSLMMVPFRFALAMQEDWILRDVIVWHKPAPMPESVRDRCTKAWEPIFMFAKSPRYFADMEGVKTPSVSKPHAPGNLKCQCNAGDPVPCVVLDPFCGSGTTMKVAAELGRDGIGLDLSTEYRALAVERIGPLNVLQQREEVAA